MGWDYGWEKLYGTARTLAFSPGELRERVRDAIIFNAIHIGEDNLPPDLWEKFSNLMAKVTVADPKGNEGTVEATLRTMSDLQLSEIAGELFDLHDSVIAR
jgi:hypothetical protein